MKKLMVAAAAAAMVGGAFAADGWANKWPVQETLGKGQVLQFKIKGSAAKYLSLNKNKDYKGDKKLGFGKTVKDADTTIDGVYYYSADLKDAKKGGKWVLFTWSKTEKYNIESVVARPPVFDIWCNADRSKAYVTPAPMWTPMGKLGFVSTNIVEGIGVANVYGTYKTTKAKEQFEIDGVKITVNAYYPDVDNTKVTNLKSTNGGASFSIKDYTVTKDGATDIIATRQKVQKAIDKLVQKAQKQWEAFD